MYETLNMRVTYQARLNENFVPEPGVTNYVTMNVEAGSYSSSVLATQNQLFDNIVTQMSGTIDKDSMVSISSKVAASVGDGTIAMAVGFTGNTIKVDYMVTKTIRISSNKTISINIKITVEFKDETPIPEEVLNSASGADESTILESGFAGIIGIVALIGEGIYFIICLFANLFSPGSMPLPNTPNL